MNQSVVALRFSLIVPTVGRSKELELLLHSLAEQSYRNFEVIVVDQSGGNDVESVMQHFSGKFPLRHLRLTTRGASRARNAGLSLASGDVIAWPDDDCAYPPDLLQYTQALFADHSDWDGLIGRAVDAQGTAHDRRGSDHPLRLSMISLLRVGVEYCLFLRRSVIERAGLFSEDFGPGAGTPWWAGEAADYELRLLRSGAVLFYNPELHIQHANQAVSEISPEAIKKTYHYAMGMGAAIRKNQKGSNRVPYWFIAYYGVLYLRAALWSLLRGHFRVSGIHLLRLKGVLLGWLTYQDPLLPQIAEAEARGNSQ